MRGLLLRFAPEWTLRCSLFLGLPGWLHAWAELCRRDTLDWDEDEDLDPRWKEVN